MEIDLVMSKGNKAWLLTMVDRKSRCLLIAKVKDKSVKTINTTLNNKLKKEQIWNKIKTITNDNWHEFLGLRKLEKSTVENSTMLILIVLDRDEQMNSLIGRPENIS